MRYISSEKDTGKMMSALILDLRNNPGGVLGSAVGISDLFLESGKIVYTKGRTNSSDLEYFANSEDILEGFLYMFLLTVVQRLHQKS